MNNELLKICDLHEHMNLSFKLILDPFQNINLKRSLINGTQINNKSIKNCNLKLTEWSGCQVVSTDITNCEFQYSEVKSTWFKNILFENSSFDDAIISDCTFSNCKFVNCSFSGTLFQENSFVSCEISNISFLEASAYLNIFNNVTFYNVEICGSLYYSIFSDCEIKECKVDQYLLGYILGFFSSKLETITYLKQGEICDLPFENLIEDLNKQYVQRLKFVNSAILKLNVQDNNIDYLIYACVIAFINCSKKDITISSDDVKFIKYVIEDYYEKQLISPCMIYEALAIVRDEYNTSNNKKNRKQLKELNNCLFFCLQSFLNSSRSKLNIDKDSTYIIYIKYDVKPQVRATELIKSLMPDYSVEPKVIKTKTGSFLEWIQADGNAVLVLEALFGFLNITIPIMYDIIKTKKGKNEKKKTKNKNIIVQVNFNNYNVQNYNNMIQTLNYNNISVVNNFMGYNNSNINEISVTKTS